MSTLSRSWSKISLKKVCVGKGLREQTCGMWGGGIEPETTGKPGQGHYQVGFSHGQLKFISGRVLKSLQMCVRTPLLWEGECPFSLEWPHENQLAIFVGCGSRKVEGWDAHVPSEKPQVEMEKFLLQSKSLSGCTWGKLVEGHVEVVTMEQEVKMW